MSAARISPPLSLLYPPWARGRESGHAGHVPDSPYFWGDLCRQRIRYVRNFVFGGLRDRIDLKLTLPILGDP